MWVGFSLEVPTVIASGSGEYTPLDALLFIRDV